ncbi:MAG: radical SAM family heme chaperone HemW [Treponema sp.]|nr:radical SAM family heme chaperone HemW [Treponema sp.]
MQDSFPELDSASLYVHIPFCRSKCDYCDFFSVGCSSSVDDAYISALLNEADFYAARYGISTWRTIYIGGGTPSLLSPSQIERLVSGLRKSACKNQTEEISMEMNPESLSEEKLVSAQKSGVTRLSLGVQSMNQAPLSAVHRPCSAKRTQDALELVSSLWKGHLNLDAIAGLPEQNMDSFLSSLEKIISYRPDHISMYTLTIEDGTPLAKRIDEGEPWDADEADRQWISGRDFLIKNGFNQYEVSNFSLPGCESRHNMAYWMQESYIGLGAGACSSVYSFERGTSGLRWTNTSDIEKYRDFWKDGAEIRTGQEKNTREEEILDLETEEYEFLMMGLRTLRGISAEEYNKRFSSLKWHGNLEERLETGGWSELGEKGLCGCARGISGDRFFLTKEGILFLNSFLRDLI